jgi:peptidoglycan/xylan/chitin deacetylase (PgdA/CDA1 family)
MRLPQQHSRDLRYQSLFAMGDWYERRPDRRLLLCSFLQFSGAISLWERIANRSLPLIVYYHSVHGPDDDISWCHEPSLSMPVELFQEQIEYLRRHYTVVSLEEAVAVADPRVVAITFDDGYRGVYQNAFPILRAHRLPATVFLVSDFVGSRSVLWWDQLLARLRVYRELPAADRAALAAKLPERWGVLVGSRPEQEILERYKTSDAIHRLQLDDFLTAAVPTPYVHQDRVFLSLLEIQEMLAGGISFGAHSRTHPLLTWLNDAQLQDELTGSRHSVEAITGSAACWFAYPDGTFTEREQRAVKSVGFAGALQTFRRPDRGGQYAVPRVGLKVASTTGRDGRLAAAKLRCVLAGMTRRRLMTALAQLRPPPRRAITFDRDSRSPDHSRAAAGSPPHRRALGSPSEGSGP